MTIDDKKTPKPENDMFQSSHEADTDRSDEIEADIEATHTNDDMSDEIEYAEAEILPPIKAEPKRGLGFKSLLTATVFAGLLGAGGGFALSYYLLPKLIPAPDVQALDTRIVTVSERTQDINSKVERLQTSVRDNMRQAQVGDVSDADMRDVRSRIEALEAMISQISIEAGMSDRVQALEQKIQALTAFETVEGEAVPVEIARRLESLEQGEASETLSVDPETFMYGDRLLRDILQEILENQIALQDEIETASASLDATENLNYNRSKADVRGDEDITADTSDTIDVNRASTWPQDSAQAKNSSKSVIGDMSSATKKLSKDAEAKTNIPVPKTREVKISEEGASEIKSVSQNEADQQDRSQQDRSQQDRSQARATQIVAAQTVIMLPTFPETEVRAALRENALSGKNWFARVIGRNLTVKKMGERDVVDDIMDLIARGKISEALDKMETLPSSVRSVAREWMAAARQNR